MAQTTRQRMQQLKAQLDADRQSFIGQWRDLADFILPTRPRFMVSQRNRGDRRNHKIIDSTASFAARTLRSGMMGGLSNPARPWIRLTHEDPSRAETPEARRWLHIVTRDMLGVFSRSNIYNVMPNLYGDCGVFATAAAFITDDDRDIIRGHAQPIGSYYLGASERGDIDTFVREFAMTVRQIVAEFGLDSVSRTVRNMWDKGQYEQWIEISHSVTPAVSEDDMADSGNRPFINRYWESGDADELFLRRGGLRDFPVLAPRWDVTGEDVYGTMCPGMEAIGDIKALQMLQKRKSQAVEKMVNPPMTGPNSLRNQKATILPGDITYIDVRDGQSGFRPAHEVRFDVSAVSNDINEHQFRIRRAFFEDLFLMLSHDLKTNRTATEILSREQEKLIVLGPVLERFNTDLFGPLVDLTFSRMLRRGLIPDPPEELQGEPLKVEYISVMAQAQKAVSSGSMERFATYVNTLAASNPDALDKFDADESIDEYGDMVGVPPSVIRTDDQVNEIRAARARQLAAAQQQQSVSELSKSAKQLSESDTSSDNALTRLLNVEPRQTQET